MREAVACCTECRQFYCRECITEHEDRAICASCLRKMAAETTPRRWRLGWAFTALPCVFGFIVLWFFFYFCGQALLSIPSSFHEGTLWTDRWWRGE